MDNFELHQRAQEMSDAHSAYELAREVLRLREALDRATPPGPPPRASARDRLTLSSLLLRSRQKVTSCLLQAIYY